MAGKPGRSPALRRFPFVSQIGIQQGVVKIWIDEQLTNRMA
jgi:hypothetical protein